MTEHDADQTQAHKLDRLLRDAYPDQPGLGADFESRVMQRVKATTGPRKAQRRVARIMLVYWIAAGLLVTILASNSGAVAPTANSIGALLLALLLTLGALIGLSRTARVRLGELLAHTFSASDHGEFTPR
ncbi:MAG: hypothetical protein R3348_00590 [Xanthomonadales bacterium]|nr:hypothetical protein [Xanthomonadales bacterium]